MTSTTAHATTTEADRDYDGFLGRIQARFEANLGDAGPVLFTTDAHPTALWAAYLDNLPDRQYHTCAACRRFVQTYGGLVVIDADGIARSAIWHEDDAPAYYRDAVTAVSRLVRRSRVTGVFLSDLTTWGIPRNRDAKRGADWTHFAVKPPANVVHKHLLLTAGQKAAEKLEDYRNVCRALAEFDAETVGTALRLLESEALYRSEKVMGPAKWLRDLHAARARGNVRDNVTWRAVATAPAGFCHPRSSMVGTLLEDIAGGMDFAEVSRRFAAKMHPLQYQRPQVAPSAGNIKAAEEVVAKLGIARSLERRFARIDEIEVIWRPKVAETTKGDPAGVFAHLKPKGAAAAPSIAVPPITMTWEKFARTVLAGAEEIDLYVDGRPDNYVALVTAVHADAPPILQWDREEGRNPVSLYVYSGGSLPGSWGLDSGRYHRVTGITLRPSMWGPDPATFAHQGKGIILVVEGAKDSRYAGAGNAIFPETLRSELHGVRSTIEAYSRAAVLGGADEASACGLTLSSGPASDWRCRLRITVGALTQEYRLDRWD